MHPNRSSEKNRQWSNFFEENPVTRDWNLKRKNYQGVFMTGTTIASSTISKSNFHNGEIHNSHLRACKIRECCFDDTLFAGTTFEQISFLKGTAFRARFKDSEFKQVISRGTDLSESKALGTKIYLSRFFSCCF